jgi:hypothetical protein
MMDTFTRADLRTLIETRQTPCVSLYMPTHRTGAELRQDPIRLKNILNLAEQRMTEMGLRTPEARNLLTQGWQRQGDQMFWQSQSDGLAMFLAPGWMRSFRVPLNFDELVIINDRFHVNPLLPLLQGDGRFFLLAVSQKLVRLFHGTRHSLSPLAPERLPRSLADVLDLGNYRNVLEWHSYRAPGLKAPDDERMLFGADGPEKQEEKKDDILQYFRRLDDALQDLFHDESAPLVFAGVEYLFPMFKETCSYRSLAADAIAGNPDGMPLEQLHAAAWQIVAPQFREDLRAAREKFGQYAARQLASTDLPAIIAAAREGRVDTLFVVRGQRAWGAVDEATGTVTPHDQAEAGKDDLLDYAVCQSLLHGAKVFSVEADDVPHRGTAAAIFRYSLVAPVEAGAVGPT